MEEQGRGAEVVEVGSAGSGNDGGARVSPE